MVLEEKHFVKGCRKCSQPCCMKYKAKLKNDKVYEESVCPQNILFGRMATLYNNKLSSVGNIIY